MDEFERPSTSDSNSDPTLNPAPNSILELFATSSTTKYLENNLQCIFKTTLKARTFVVLVAFPNKPYN